jgi:large subunit ribosomal protein L18
MSKIRCLSNRRNKTMSRVSRNDLRKKRHKRVRSKAFGTRGRPRMCLYRSLKGIYAQIIDDEAGVTLASASTLSKELKGKIKNNNRAAAKAVGELIAEKAVEKGIKEVAFDRGGYLYHGRVKALADAAREKGLKF